ncbi:MAG: hypothetical protein A3F63_07540 [Pseudomonadales bacterium RIFCSPHIGHO2_12_FULL_40_16]|jgi:hypothetical protein|nr:MAG: hypothetical protein A3F63_07540 [Pseudomonadales bacterium RIFCSPHIGHO2_12_FULL_40_16]BCX75794.1 hypothetical protein TOL5_39940 [Acinetobacter sp. Tol 5]
MAAFKTRIFQFFACVCDSDNCAIELIYEVIGKLLILTFFVKAINQLTEQYLKDYKPFVVLVTHVEQLQ